MATFLYRCTIVAVGCLALFVLFTCGKESPTKPSPPQPPPQPPPPQAPVSTRIEITPTSVSLHSIGQTQQLTARVFDQNNSEISGIPVVWSSSNLHVASIDSRRGLMTARGPGMARITAQTLTVSASIDVTVTQTVAGMKIEPSQAMLTAIGDTIQVAATALDQHGHPIEEAVVEWSSSDDAVATVSKEGLVTGVGNGTADIIAQSGEYQASVDVSVMQAASSIAIEPGEAKAVLVGETIQLSATVLDRNEYPIIDAVVDWLSSDEAVAAVSPQGLVTAVGEGTAQITARSEDAAGMTVFLVSTMEAGPDLEALIALYNATDGQNWSNNTNWLSGEPLASWHGLDVDGEGRISWIALPENQLTGRIPPELGQLSGLTWLNLYRNQLSGEIPPELGQLENLEYLSLSNNRLSGEIPHELGQLDNLRILNIANDQLSGEIPAELGRLENLQILDLSNNRLTGGIPTELARLSGLTWLDLGANGLTGGISPELGRLEKLEFLSLANNQLSGEIPSELGLLNNLESINLYSNKLIGGIPTELGQLSRLTFLSLGANRLTGEIPSELGQLLILEELWLPYNELTGEIPPELGQLKNLVVLNFHENRLTGELPESFGGLNSLMKLDLSNNGGLTGNLPATLTELMLDELRLDLTRLCEPSDSELWDWLNTIPTANVNTCSEDFLVRTTAILTQAAQNLDSSVPLVAGEDALMRVFVVGFTPMETPMPRVTARFYLNGEEVLATTVQNEGQIIPSVLDLGDLASSVNATVSGGIVRPGLEMIVEIDSGGLLSGSLQIPSRLPAEGRTLIAVQEVPPFRLTVVPLVWTENPDEVLLSEINSLTAGSEYFRQAMDYLPIHELYVTVRSPVFVSDELSNTSLALRQIQMIRTMDGADGHYLGIGAFGGGRAFRPGLDTVSSLNGFFIGHELGHNLSLGHAPCGNPDGIDLGFPYPDGNIGVWGYDHRTEELVPPFTADHMSACGPPDWTSDYNFIKAMNYRLSQVAHRGPTLAYSSSGTSLLIWGGIGEAGELFLEPSFVVDAPPSLPGGRGPYRLTAGDAEGNTLFELSFSMSESAYNDGGGFAVVLPVNADWSARLEHIEVSGPEGYAVISRESGRSAALLLDENTGELRGILRDWQEPGPSRQAARRTLPEPGLEVIFSSGIPDAADWER